MVLDDLMIAQLKRLGLDQLDIMAVDIGVVDGPEPALLKSRAGMPCWRKWPPRPVNEPNPSRRSGQLW